MLITCNVCPARAEIHVMEIELLEADPGRSAEAVDALLRDMAALMKQGWRVEGDGFLCPAHSGYASEPP